MQRKSSGQQNERQETANRSKRKAASGKAQRGKKKAAADKNGHAPGCGFDDLVRGHVEQAQGEQAPPKLKVLPALAVKTQRTEWLWRDRLEWSTVAFIQGAKGAGKSTWCRAIAADVTGGPCLLDPKAKRRVAGNVLWFAGEEPVGSKVVPGLAAAGADLARVHLSDGLGESSEVLALPRDCDRLAALIRAEGAALVVIDPLFAFLDGSIDVEAGSVPARQFVGTLMKVAASTGALILLARNLTKDTSRGALAAGRGSGELGNAARSVLHCQALPHQLNVYGLATAACNSGRPAPTVRYTFADSDGAGTIEVLGECQLSADELAGGDDADVDRSQLAEAMLLIRAALPDGELPSGVIHGLAERARITPRTLQLAGQRLGVRHRREGRRENVVVYWIAPDHYPAF